MAVLSEILELLRRWDVWERIEKAPERIDELEERIKTLETSLEKCPGEACPHCGARALRLKGVGRMLGGRDAYRDENWECEDCGFKDKRVKHFTARHR